MTNAYHTYISKKQIGVIFGNNKRGNITVSNEIISWLYNSCAEVRGCNYNDNFESVLYTIKSAIDEIFKNEYEKAQADIERAYRQYKIIFQG